LIEEKFSAIPYTDAMVDYDLFARWLKDCEKHPDAAGTIELSFADACNLVSMGFRDAVPGRWMVPPLAPEITRRYPERAVYPGDSDKANDHGVMTAPVTDGRSTLPLSPYRRVPLTMEARLRDALGDPIQRRVVLSLSRRNGAGCTKRQLQQRLRRIAADVLNAALTTLVEAHVILWDARALALNPEAHRLLVAARIGVRRSRSARAWRPEKTQTGPDLPRTRAWTGEPDPRPDRDSGPAPVRPRKRTGPRRYQPRPVPDRRRHPSAWGRSMRAKRGGLAVQRLYRRLGLHPTAAATDAHQRKLMPPFVRQAPTGSVPTTPSFTSNSDGRSPIVASQISTALACNQPIGRRERLAIERNRR
jgi:hypothetical protein